MRRKRGRRRTVTLVAGVGLYPSRCLQLPHQPRRHLLPRPLRLVAEVAVAPSRSDILGRHQGNPITSGMRWVIVIFYSVEVKARKGRGVRKGGEEEEEEEERRRRK